MKKKVCVVTGTRAEYGLLYWLIKEIDKDEDMELQLVVTGMHLSSEFGCTYKEIEKETGIPIGTLMSRRHRAISLLYKKLKHKKEIIN